MKNLLKKEFTLAMHPTILIFMSLSMMLIIPNYPYYVTFFYTGLATFFTCLNGRENKDIFYTMMLPVAKKDIVRARITFVVIVQMAQILVAVPFAIIRQRMTAIPGNQVGMDANIAFFGLALAMMGLFNYVFFVSYYKDVNKVGQSFVKSSIVVFVYMIIAEALTHIVPFMRDVLDTSDPLYLNYKLIVLGAGAVVYALLTFVACRKSIKTFVEQDL